LEPVDVRFKISKRIDEIIQRTVKEGIFTTKSDFYKSAAIHYLDQLHLLDQLKNAIETHRLDK